MSEISKDAHVDKFPDTGDAPEDTKLLVRSLGGDLLCELEVTRRVTGQELRKLVSKTLNVSIHEVQLLHGSFIISVDSPLLSSLPILSLYSAAPGDVFEISYVKVATPFKFENWCRSQAESSCDFKFIDFHKRGRGSSAIIGPALQRCSGTHKLELLCCQAGRSCGVGVCLRSLDVSQTFATNGNAFDDDARGARRSKVLAVSASRSGKPISDSDRIQMELDTDNGHLWVRRDGSLLHELEIPTSWRNAEMSFAVDSLMGQTQWRIIYP